MTITFTKLLEIIWNLYTHRFILARSVKWHLTYNNMLLISANFNKPYDSAAATQTCSSIWLWFFETKLQLADISIGHYSIVSVELKLAYIEEIIMLVRGLDI